MPFAQKVHGFAFIHYLLQFRDGNLIAGLSDPNAPGVTLHHVLFVVILTVSKLAF